MSCLGLFPRGAVAVHVRALSCAAVVAVPAVADFLGLMLAAFAGDGVVCDRHPERTDECHEVPRRSLVERDPLVRR